MKDIMTFFHIALNHQRRNKPKLKNILFFIILNALCK